MLIARLAPTIVGIAFALSCTCFTRSTASGQTPPAYPELFQDPPRTDQLSQADLPNLARLIVLAATSMFARANAELYESPAGVRLLGQITDLWNWADLFAAAVSSDPLATQPIEAGRLIFPDVEAAFGQIREVLGRLPGPAPGTSQDFANLSRVIAVVGPLLRQNPPGPAAAAAVVQPPGSPDDLRRRAQELGLAVAAFRGALREPDGRPGRSGEIEEKVAVLLQLVQGFARILGGQPEDREVVDSFRPIRSRAQALDASITAGRPAAAVQGRWRTIQEQVDGLARRFQLPREIVVRPNMRAPSAVDPSIASQIDRAAREIETSLGPAGPGTPRISAAPLIQADARRLQTRLLVLRQQILGQEPAPRLSQALGDVETAWRQLSDRIRPSPPDRRQANDRLARDLDATIARVRDQLPRTR
jgi:hypothetical protein